MLRRRPAGIIAVTAPRVGQRDARRPGPRPHRSLTCRDPMPRALTPPPCSGRSATAPSSSHVPCSFYHTALKSTWPSTATGRTVAGLFKRRMSCSLGRKNSASGILRRAGADTRHGATSSRDPRVWQSRGIMALHGRRSNGFSTAWIGLKRAGRSSSDETLGSDMLRTWAAVRD